MGVFLLEREARLDSLAIEEGMTKNYVIRFYSFLDSQSQIEWPLSANRKADNHADFSRSHIAVLFERAAKTSQAASFDFLLRTVFEQKIRPVLCNYNIVHSKDVTTTSTTACKGQYLHEMGLRKTFSFIKLWIYIPQDLPKHLEKQDYSYFIPHGSHFTMCTETPCLTAGRH